MARGLCGIGKEKIDMLTYFIICPLVFLAGFVDAIAGGGGLISLPAYMIAGVPVHQAIGTNKLSSATGTLVSTVRYCKRNHMDLLIGIPSIVVALVGSAVVANLALLTSAAILKGCLVVVLPVIAFYILKKKPEQKEGAKVLSRKVAVGIAIVVAFVIGMYDGFYGPGTGTFLLLFYTKALKMDTLTASGNVKLVNLSSNVAALVTYIINGKVLFILGLVASVFSIAGHYTGSEMVLKKDSRIVRPVILVVLVLLFIKVISEW